jgi:hypothetical protein
MCVEIATITQFEYKGDRRGHHADSIRSNKVAMRPRFRQDRCLGQKSLYFILRIHNKAAQNDEFEQTLSFKW